MQTLIRFNGHVNHKGRGDGLPETIYAFRVLQDPDAELINKVIEHQINTFTSRQMMFVQRNQNEMVDLYSNLTSQMAVPFHNLACIDTDVIPMVGELSTADESGKELLPNGEEPVKQ
jgi:hypothetical protein